MLRCAAMGWGNVQTQSPPASIMIWPALAAAGHAHGGGGGTGEDDCGGGGGHSHAAKVAPRMRWREVWLLVAGVLLPLLLNLQGHGH